MGGGRGLEVNGWGLEVDGWGAGGGCMGGGLEVYGGGGAGGGLVGAAWNGWHHKVSTMHKCGGSQNCW